MKHKEATILYCSRCRMTTPHAVDSGSCTCKRCGSVKATDRVKVRHKSSNSAHGDALAEAGGHWN